MTSTTIYRLAFLWSKAVQRTT